jgi:hypothetical protein
VNHIHHTEAIVLGGYPKGEADRQIVLYTRDLGLVRADARGIRKVSSKLRFALQPYMIVQADLIVTRAAYRAGSTDLIESIGLADMPTLSILHRISLLVRRLVPEEEKNEPLFEAITEVIRFLSKKDQQNLKNNESINETGQTGQISHLDTASLELLAVFRILYHLGYITESGERSLIREPITGELLEQVKVRRESLVQEVNKSLKETML